MEVLKKQLLVYFFDQTCELYRIICTTTFETLEYMLLTMLIKFLIVSVWKTGRPTNSNAADDATHYIPFCD